MYASGAVQLWDSCPASAAGLVYEGTPRCRSRIFRIDPVNRVISTLELRPPGRALALWRGRTGCQVASCSLHSLLILVTPVLTTPRCCRMVSCVHGRAPVTGSDGRQEDILDSSTAESSLLVQLGVGPRTSLSDFPHLAGLHFTEHLQQSRNERQKVIEPVRKSS
jgi:hypothetical protein